MNAAYGGEKLIAYLFLPTTTRRRPSRRLSISPASMRRVCPGFWSPR